MIWHVLGLFAIIVIYNVARYFLLDDGDDGVHRGRVSVSLRCKKEDV